MTHDDSQLLAEYAQTGSPEAFRALVDHHLPLVHAAARRQMRDPADADDVAQAVFIVLARKAGTLRNPALLPAWLLKITHFTAANARMAAARRRHYEQEAAAMVPENVLQPDPAWEGMSPHIDAALARLSQSDRAAVLGHCVGQQSLAELAAALHLSEPAIRKRIQRALERLRTWLPPHGTAPTIALPALMAAHFIPASPSSLSAAALATTALAGAHGTLASCTALTLAKGTLNMLTLLKIKLAAIVTALILSVGITAMVGNHILAKADDPRPVASTAPATQPVIEWGAANEGVQTRLRAEKREWKAGQTPKLLADFRNNGQRKLRVVLASGYWEVELDGVWYRESVDNLGRLLEKPLGPGAVQPDFPVPSLDSSVGWRSEDDDEPLEFTAGKHTMRIAANVLPAQMGDGEAIRAVSNRVEIEILPASAPTTQAAKRYPARQFSSQVRMVVYVRVGKSDDGRLVGMCPTNKPLEIPACEAWWVWAMGGPLADVVKEVKAQAIPGLQFPWEATDDDLAVLKDLAGLETLDLSATKVTDAGLKRLKDLTRLRELGLSGTPVTDAGLEQLKSLSRLQMLDLLGTKMTDVGLEHLKGLPDLQRLRLDGTPVTDAGLKRLKDLTRLQTLGLAATQVTDAGLEELKGLAGLESLDLRWTKVTGTGLEQLKDLTDLQMLWLDGPHVTDAGLEHLKGLTALQTLGLRGTQITDAGMEQLKSCKGLQRLDLYHTRVTDAGLEQIKGLTGLHRLDLGWTNVTDAGLEHLKGLTGLQELRLSQTKVTDAGLEHLKGLTGLQELWLSGTQVTDAGLKHLKGLTGLQTLNLWGTQVTDAGLEQIKGLTGLQSLDLTETGVTDAGMVHLKALTHLQTLSLQDTEVTDDGLKQLKGLTELQSLNLHGTDVTVEGVSALKKAIPGIGIVR